MDFSTGNNHPKKKIAIIGAGYVGSSIAYALTIHNVACDIVFIDVDNAKALGEVDDIRHGIPFMGNAFIRGGDYSDCADCDLIIITAGRNRRPGETRLTLIDSNIAIMRSIMENLSRYYSRGVILIVSNPVDILVHLCQQWLSLPQGKIFGTGCLLDTSRLVRVVSDYVSLNSEAVHGFVVGEHGDSQVPIWSRLTVQGMPISEYCSDNGIPWSKELQEQITAQVKRMGADIISAKGKTHYGIATCVCYLADAILSNTPTIASVSSPLYGEYDVNDVALSIPSVVSSFGIEKKPFEVWSGEELSLFHQSAARIKETISLLKV